MAKEKSFQFKVGAGMFHVYGADEGYGQINVDLVVERDGKKISLPIVVVENPNDSNVETANSTTIYAYGTLDDDAYTHKIVIPNEYIDDAIAAY